jgi:hypothetical protein
MIFPVMMRGGLTDPAGSGVAQVLKVRLIHATVRNLILRGSPQHRMTVMACEQATPSATVLAPHPHLKGGHAPSGSSLHEALSAHGWHLGEDGLPCNQEELAYTLLTFGYVFLRSLRRLGIGLARADEEAFLHCWNVVGHLLGIRRELMAETMEEAAALFALMQTRGCSKVRQPDPRPPLAQALMAAMESAIPWAVAKPFPVLMTRHLCGRATAQQLGLGRVPWLSRMLFGATMALARGIDAMLRTAWPGFSISRFFTRVLGYRFITRVLMDQTRSLVLPDHLLQPAQRMMNAWSDDPKAPRWLNALEDRLTRPGLWAAPPGH